MADLNLRGFSYPRLLSYVRTVCRAPESVGNVFCFVRISHLRAFFFSTAVAARCGSADGSPYIYILMDSAPRYAENHSEPLRSGGGGCVCLTKPSTLYPIQLRPSLVPVYLVSHVPDKFLGFFVLFCFLGRPEGGWGGVVWVDNHLLFFFPFFSPSSMF